MENQHNLAQPKTQGLRDLGAWERNIRSWINSTFARGEVGRLVTRFANLYVCAKSVMYHGRWCRLEDANKKMNSNKLECIELVNCELRTGLCLVHFQ